MSREECCRSGRLGTYWTEEDVPNSTLFRWTIFNGGAPNCMPCKGASGTAFKNKFVLYQKLLSDLTEPFIKKKNLCCKMPEGIFQDLQGLPETFFGPYV